MQFYALIPNDLPHERWLLFDQISTKGTFSFRPKRAFEDLVCRKCYQADHDAVFQRGFNLAGEFKSRLDLLGTNEGFFCISGKVKELFSCHRIGGVKFKPVGTDGWHVMSVSLRVEAVRGVYESDGGKCRDCGRADSVGGAYDFESQVSLPTKPPAFFTVIHERQGTHKGRDIFVSEDIVEIMKSAGLTGCSFRRLLTPEEENENKRSLKLGDERWPKDCFVNL